MASSSDKTYASFPTRSARPENRPRGGTQNDDPGTNGSQSGVAFFTWIRSMASSSLRMRRISRSGSEASRSSSVRNPFSVRNLFSGRLERQRKARSCDEERWREGWLRRVRVRARVWERDRAIVAGESRITATGCRRQGVWMKMMRSTLLYLLVCSENDTVLKMLVLF